LVMLLVAAVIDVRSRRIPNWLSLPFLGAGMAAAGYRGGVGGLVWSLGGVGLAVVVAGILCYLRGMGMGDLKLLAAVGAWIGPGQLFIALVATGITGGLLAVAYALWHHSLGRSLANAAKLIAELPERGFRPHRTIALDNAMALKMPYAPAIAIGTIYSFLR
jgi:prepilin peptidase CpaA